MDRVTHSDVEARVRKAHRHTYAEETERDECRECGEAWPCEAIALADALARERAARDQAEGERERLREVVRQADTLLRRHDTEDWDGPPSWDEARTSLQQAIDAASTPDPAPCTVHRWAIPVRRVGDDYEQEYDTSDSVAAVREGRGHIVAMVFCRDCGQEGDQG